MKRHLSVAEDFLVSRDEVVVEIAAQEIKDFAIEATLLREELSTTLVLRSPTGQRVELSVQAADVRAKVRQLDSGDYHFELASNQVGTLQMFLLRAYREGMADVNHIHLEGIIAGREMDLTLLFQVYKPPMPPDEAEKLIRD
jgi:hypothetical protein